MKFLLKGFITVYYGLLRILRSFNMDITGLSLRILLTLNQGTKKSLETLTFEKKTGKIEPIYYRYYGILRNRTEYYGP